MKHTRALLFALFLGVFCTNAQAQRDVRPYVHIVREGDTLASIAERYYGDARREKILVTENGLHVDGAAIVVGMRLHIPTISYHRVAPGETWSSIAVHYFGASRRAQAIISANPNVHGAVDPGAVIVIPYPLRHIASQAEDLVEIARHYYDDAAAVTTLHQFNNLRGGRLERGQLVLVPIFNLTLSNEATRLLNEDEASTTARGMLDQQALVDTHLREIHEDNRHGRYVEALASAQRLLGSGVLTQRQEVTVQDELATAYVALERHDLATVCFVRALTLAPDFRKDEVQTSPRILAAFNAARERARPTARAGEP